MTHTVVDGRGDGWSPAELAAQHGLSVSTTRPSLPAYIRQLWSRRHFIVAFSRAKLAATYSSARLGRVWQVLTPLLNAAVYTLIFGLLINSTRGVENVVGFITAGVFIFGFTQQAITNGARSVSGNLGLIRALHFPRASMPLASTLTQLQQMLFTVGVLLIVMLATRESIQWQWLLIIPAIALQTLFNTGMALGVARIASNVPDLTQVLPFVLRTWMYGSGVLFAASRFIDQAPDWIAFLLRVNPLAVYIELVRYALLADPALTSSPQTLWLLAAGWAVVVGFCGFVYFWRGEETYGRG